MNILFVSHSFPAPAEPLSNVGGMQRVATELFEALGKRPDVKVIPLVLETSQQQTAWRFLPFYTRLWRQIPRLVVAQKIDMILFSSLATATSVLFLKDFLKRHPVLTAAITHGLDVTLDMQLYQMVLPRVFSHLNLVFPVSRATAQECLHRGLEPSRCLVVPNGINPARFAQNVSVAKDSSIFMLGTVGRLIKRKGVAWFIEQVMPRLPSSVHYTIIGTGPELGHIHKAIRKQGLGARVHLRGRASEVELHHYYRKMDLFIMPNVPVPHDPEGFGVVLLEANANGIPCIASDLEGITDVIVQGQNGHLIQPLNAKAFADMIHYYQTHPLERNALSHTAQSFALKNFAWPVVTERYVNALQRAVSLQSAELTRAN
jgi:phosphatidyl-myo-inositol dimannoside synthase